MRWMLLATLLCSFSAWTYPIVLKIKNPRAHSLFLISKAHGQKFEIPAGTEREVVLLDGAQNQDWQLAYATGFTGAFAWTVQLTIQDLVARLKDAAGEHWKGGELKIGRVELVEDEGAKKFKLAQEMTGMDANQFLIAAQPLTTPAPGLLLPVGDFLLTGLLVPTRALPNPRNDTTANSDLPLTGAVTASFGTDQGSL